MAWVALLGVMAPGRVTAQGSGVAEWRVQGLAAAADRAFLGGGPAAGFGTGRLRGRLVAAVGSYDGEVGGRGEALLTFHLDPFKRSGVGVYGGGGASVTFNGRRSDEYVVVLVGLESAPADRRGWFAEVGLGGGVRFAAGVRFRRAREVR